MSKPEIKPLQVTIEEFATLSRYSTSKLWDLTNTESRKFDPTAPLRIKRGGSTRFDMEQIEEWLKAPARDQQKQRKVGSP